MSFFQRIVMGARGEVARRAEVCVLPNEERVEIFKKQTGTDRPVECVWNVPRLEEVTPVKGRPNAKEPLALFYGGSLSSDRLPDVLIDQIAELYPKVVLHVVGYATYSHRALHQRILELSKQGRMQYYGAMPRREMWKITDMCEAAVCLIPSSTQDINLRHMVGASNKPFDAMARGLAVMVSDLPDWTELYLEEHTKEAGGGRREAGRELGICPSKEVFRIPSPENGFGIAINPESRESIRAGLDWMLAKREKLWEMGERGRQRIQNKWNYETQFNLIHQKLNYEQENNSYG